jgi:hypothetical protein
VSVVASLGEGWAAISSSIAAIMAAWIIGVLAVIRYPLSVSCAIAVLFDFAATMAVVWSFCLRLSGR